MVTHLRNPITEVNIINWSQQLQNPVPKTILLGEGMN